MNYHIFIPTRGRVGQQLTWERLPEAIRKKTTLVCPYDEITGHSTVGLPTLAQPSPKMTIAAKREWIMKQSQYDFTFMFDDDLFLYEYVEGKGHKRCETAFDTLLRNLTDEYPIVGLGTKFFALPGGVKENYHLGFAFGMRKDVIPKIEWNRIEYYEDIDYTLQALRKGIRIGITYDLVVQQRKANAPGGCTGQRDQEALGRALDALIALHPGLVRRKALAPGAHPGANTLISWKKAAKEGGLT